jgi:hypothetical protein
MIPVHDALGVEVLEGKEQLPQQEPANGQRGAMGMRMTRHMAADAEAAAVSSMS